MCLTCFLVGWKEWVLAGTGVPRGLFYAVILFKPLLQAKNIEVLHLLKVRTERKRCALQSEHSPVKGGKEIYPAVCRAGW